jgi:hypothetical protein
MKPTSIKNHRSYTPYVVSGNDINDVCPQGYQIVYDRGVKTSTRNGPAWSLPSTLVSHYEYPQFRVLFEPLRDANPFFHLFESLWMIAGREDLRGVSQFVASMENYSDDGVTLNGAYGYRWRNTFQQDQLKAIVKELKTNPQSRRCVLQMWSADHDLFNQSSKDLCCNLLVKYRILDGALHAYVMNRSNDVVFGAYGANVFHFSFLQEYLADLIGVRVGPYQQISTDAHMYGPEVYGEKLYNNVLSIVNRESAGRYKSAYSDKDTRLYALSPLRMVPSWMESPFGPQSFSVDKLDNYEASDQWFVAEVNTLIEGYTQTNTSTYGSLVLTPMFSAYRKFKNKDHQGAIDTLELASGALNGFLSDKFETTIFKDQPFVLDLFEAGTQWLQRRLDAINSKTPSKE